jgi:hypothetical protein
MLYVKVSARPLQHDWIGKYREIDGTH